MRNPTLISDGAGGAVALSSSPFLSAQFFDPKNDQAYWDSSLAHRVKKTPHLTNRYFVQSNVKQSTSTQEFLSCSFEKSTTAGNTLLVLVTSDSVNASQSWTITDTQGNSYQFLKQSGSGGGGFIQVWACFSCAGGPCTVTVSRSGVLIQKTVIVSEYQRLYSMEFSSAGNKTTPVTFDPNGSNVVAIFAATTAYTNIPVVSKVDDVAGSYATREQNANTGAGMPWMVLSDALLSAATTPTFSFSSSVPSSYSLVLVGLSPDPPLPPPPKQPPQQKWFDLPDYWQYRASYRQPPLASTYVPPPPPTRQPSQQRWFPLPDYWQHWDAFRPEVSAQFYVFEKPPTRQPSQRFDPLLDYDDVWFRQRYVWPVPEGYIPTPPPTRQSSQQLSYDLPDYWQEWDAFKAADYSQFYVAEKPPTHQSSQQLYHEPPDFWAEWQAYRANWPEPQERPKIRPPTRQPSQQLYFQPPDFNDVWWRQRRISPIPVGSVVIVGTHLGLSGIYNEFSGVIQSGGFRIANDIAGYNVWVGEDALPDLSGTPDSFSQTLPFSIPITPPVSGIKVLYVVVTEQNQYGLNSVNQTPTIIRIDSLGEQILPALDTPQNLGLIPQTGGMLRVLAGYRAFTSDEYPADVWRIWVDTVPPNPLADDPTAEVDVEFKTIRAEIGPLAAGTYHVAVALYRSEDDHQSEAITGIVDIPELPERPDAVPGGFEI